MGIGIKERPLATPHRLKIPMCSLSLHHREEVEAFIHSIRLFYSQKQILMVKYGARLDENYELIRIDQKGIPSTFVIHNSGVDIPFEWEVCPICGH
jgi:hypothetical protein